MNKKEVVVKISRDAGISSSQAEKAFISFIQGIKDALKKGKRVTFSGFGSFEVRHRKASKGRNPRTGKPIVIPSAKKVKFIPSKSFNAYL